MSAENVALIKGIHDAFAAADVPGVLGAMAPGIIWNEADDFRYADGDPYVGPQSVAEGVFMRCTTEWDGFGVEVDELIDAGETVAALGYYAYVGTYKATGKAQRTQLAHVWRIADGKAAAFQQYANALHAAHVTGAAF